MGCRVVGKLSLVVLSLSLAACSSTSATLEPKDLGPVELEGHRFARDANDLGLIYLQGIRLSDSYIIDGSPRPILTGAYGTVLIEIEGGIFHLTDSASDREAYMEERRFKSSRGIAQKLWKSFAPDVHEGK